MTESVVSDTAYLAQGLPTPRPARDGLDEPYWTGAREHRLLVQQCRDCDRHQWGPEWMCHNCQSFEVDWTEVAGRGVIYSWQRPHHPVHPALRDQGPYVVVLVELPDADGVRMVGNLLGDPLQEVIIGTEVEAVFEDHDAAADGSTPAYTLVQWRVTAQQT